MRTPREGHTRNLRNDLTVEPMKERLEQLTVARFVDLLCGETDVLVPKHEFVSERKKAEIARNIMIEYRQIADPAGLRRYLSDSEDMIKARNTVFLFELCHRLVLIHEFERVREILHEYGLNAGGMDDRRLEAEVVSRLERARLDVVRMEEVGRDHHGADNDEIRRHFDEQTAALMAYFKFQIDPVSMGAAIYAHLVARYDRELKARLAAIHK